MEKTLIIVDVQKGQKIIPLINRLSRSGLFHTVVATQDWHPEEHISFASVHGLEPFTFHAQLKQTLWPVHCVQGSPGAEFHPDLDTRPVQYILRKGMSKDLDSYSAFLENDKKTPTGLFRLLDPDAEVFIVGIATDVCVFNTAIDALLGSYPSVSVITDGCAGVSDNGIKQALEAMAEKGIQLVESASLPLPVK